MEDFSKMTKAEKMKVLEEDYLERKEKEKFELHERQRRSEKWQRIRISIGILMIMLALFTLFVGFVVAAVIEVEDRGESIAGAVVFGIMNVFILYAIIYNSFK